ncbi:hypothetical protein [Halosimplex halophilum]|uniref:hypothetical protein n=1 Tax=Halosimplex halophilum TaxID=2559572 RepID=UPI00107FAFF3|nr:hypothetical protein [Halosimplex halophilum]
MQRNGGRPDGESRSGGDDAETDRPAPATLADATAADGEAVLADLIEAGAVDASGDDVALAADFGRRWQAEIEALRDADPADLAAATLAAAPAASAVEATIDRDRTYVVLSDGADEPAGEVWIRRPVAVAETAAARALAATTDLAPERRAVAAHGLSVFLDACPICETDLDARKAGGCCGPPRTDAEGHPLRALVCPDCRTQFAAFE